MEDLELPEDFIEVKKEDTEYNMQKDYRTYFHDPSHVKWITPDITPIETIKEVHLYRDMFKVV